MYSDARKLLRLSCPFLNCSNSAEIRLSLLNKSLIWCLICWMVVFRARDLNCLTNRCSSSFAPSLVKFTSPENFTFFPFMNSIIFLPFVKHRLSSSVCFNELCQFNKTIWCLPHDALHVPIKHKTSTWSHDTKSFTGSTIIIMQTVWHSSWCKLASFPGLPHLLLVFGSCVYCKWKWKVNIRETRLQIIPQITSTTSNKVGSVGTEARLQFKYLMCQMQIPDSFFCWLGQFPLHLDLRIG